MKKETEDNPIKENNKKSWIVILILTIVLIGVVAFAANSIMQNRTNTRNPEIISITNDCEDVDMNMMSLKPIIYLYPEKETSLVVKLGSPEKLSCTYPKYKETGWDVTAYPDGTLIDNETGRSLYSLYWEGINKEEIEFNEGFCIKGEDTIKFLEEKLEVLGLNEKEAEEFIVYWLPKIENNKYNLIRFASMEEIEENMPLEFSIEPDTIIRVLMQFKGMDNYIEIPEQELETPERAGFVAVEWGGTEIK